MKFNFAIITFFMSLNLQAKDSLQYHCGGNEPSFSLKINDKNINFGSASVEPFEAKVIHSELKNSIIFIKAKSPKKQMVDIKISSTSCISDGGKEAQTEKNTVDLKIGNEVYNGCCSKRKK